MTDKEKDQICRWWYNHELTGFRKTFSGKTYPSTADMQEFRMFIDSLPVSEEEPCEIDFEQELYKAFGQVKDFTLGMRIAKWFYDMGRKHQEPVGEELEEAAMSYGRSVVQHTCDELRKEYGGEYTPGEDNVLLVAKYFKAGAKWQKVQMMKDAVDGVVEYKYSRSGKNLFDVGSRVLLDAAKYHVDDGGKVKLIIVKED